MTDKHERELDAAQAQLQQLLDERSTLSAQLALASGEKNFDADAFVASQERADRLPIFIIAAEVRVGRARVAVLEERVAGQLEPVQREIAACNETYARLQEAQRANTEALIRRDNLRAQLAASQMDLSTAKRELERLLRQATRPHAPVVRSLPHAA
jgi:uncharacterized protein YhaN